MAKMIIATIADVENALVTFKAAASKDRNLEATSGKKLAAAVEYLTAKDGVTKDLSYAYTNGEKWHAVSAKKKLNGCNYDNELDKIKEYIMKTDAYARHYGNPDTVGKVEAWLADKFPVVGAAEA